MRDRQIMHAKDAISGSLGECYTTIDGRRYNLMQVINVEAKFEKTKVEVPILGKTGKGNKSTGWKGSGSFTIHYNTSLFRQMVYKYAATGEDTYFDMQITNEDPTSTVGRQTVILKDCNIDEAVIAKIDADADYLDDEISFTFEGMEMPEVFSLLEGM